MRDIAIIDYGMCNLDSVARAVEECGDHPVVTDDPSMLARAEKIILPGVGAFPDAMKNLHDRGLVAAMNEQVLNTGIPFLGICLGMQLLMSKGYEGMETAGLGWIKGEVRKLVPTSEDTRIPHVGWNTVERPTPSPLFEGIAPDKDFYFVHSFRVIPEDSADILGTTPYAGGFVSAVHRDNIWATQFHPEKSQKAGFQLLRNFLAFS